MIEGALVLAIWLLQLAHDASWTFWIAAWVMLAFLLFAVIYIRKPDNGHP